MRDEKTKQPQVGVASLCIRSSGRCAYWISTTVMPAPPKRCLRRVVGYAADGVEVLADNGAQGAGAVEDAYAVLLEEDGVVDEVVDGGEGFFCTHTAHVEFGDGSGASSRRRRRASPC